MRQQYRPKQGLFLQMLPFNSISADQIEEESVLRNIMKMTVTCWTHCIYRYPPLTHQAWSYWRELHNEKLILDSLLMSLHKNWKSNDFISNSIIKACPFCTLDNTNSEKKATWSIYIFTANQSIFRKLGNTVSKI
jgi:hypothetical protein